MLLHKYELVYTVPYDVYAHADKLVEELLVFPVYGTYRLYKNGTFVKTYKNTPGFGFYHNSFRPTAKVSCESDNEAYSVNFALELNKPVKILFAFFVVYLFAFLIIFIILSIKNCIDPLFIFLPLGMLAVVCLMTFIGYKAAARIHINAIRKLMSQKNCIAKG